MKKFKIVLITALLAFSTTNFAATMRTVVNAELNEGQWWSVIVHGQPTEYYNVGAYGGGWGVKEMKGDLAGNTYGDYRITDINFFIGSLEDSNNESNFKPCSVRDYTSAPVNDVNARVLIKIYSENRCEATVMAGSKPLP